MWFKRKKKTEQDQLLSESLKSLQTLVSESSDRLEPNLEPRHTGTNMDNADDNDTVGESRPDPHEATELDEPSVPDSGNRWKDLSLSFDAEPVAPRSRRGKEAGKDVHAPGTDRETKQRQADKDTPEATVRRQSPDRPATDPDAPDQEPVGRMAADQASVRAGLQNPDQAETEEPEMDLELEDIPEHETPPSEAAATAPAVISAGDPGEDDDGELSIEYFDRGEPPDTPVETVDDTPMLEIELPPLENDTGTNTQSEPEGKPNENQEDQLHLELEPGDGDIPADIPTLTEAVYVPDVESEARPEVELAPVAPDETPAEAREPAVAPDETPAEARGTAAPPDDSVKNEETPTITEESLESPGRIPSRFDEHVEQCLENLQVRFQLMGLDVLSPQQETELRDTLIELLDDLELPGGDQA